MNPSVIIAAIEAAERLITFIFTAINEAKRTSAWTPEQEAQVDARIADAFAKPHWQIATERKPEAN